MLRHIVLYRLRPELGAQGMERIDALIRALPSNVPGVLELQVGSNVGPPGFTQGYDWGFCMRFVDRDGRDDFMKHAFHLWVAEQVTELIDGLVVLDLEQ